MFLQMTNVAAAIVNGGSIWGSALLNNLQIKQRYNTNCNERGIERTAATVLHYDGECYWGISGLWDWWSTVWLVIKYCRFQEKTQGTYQYCGDYSARAPADNPQFVISVFLKMLSVHGAANLGPVVKNVATIPYLQKYLRLRHPGTAQPMLFLLAEYLSGNVI